MDAAKDCKITVTKNGPFLVEGAVPMARQTIVSDSEGDSRGLGGRRAADQGGDLQIFSEHSVIERAGPS